MLRESAKNSPKYQVKTYFHADNTENVQLETDSYTEALKKLVSLVEYWDALTGGKAIWNLADSQVHYDTGTVTMAAYILECENAPSTPEEFSRIRFEFKDWDGLTRVWAEGDPGDEQAIIWAAQDQLRQYCEDHNLAQNLFDGRWTSNSGVEAGQYGIQ